MQSVASPNGIEEGQHSAGVESLSIAPKNPRKAKRAVGKSDSPLADTYRAVKLPDMTSSNYRNSLPSVRRMAGANPVIGQGSPKHAQDVHRWALRRSRTGLPLAE